LTYCAYIVFYFSRKPFSTVKPMISASLSLSTQQLGWVDTSFLFAYAASQFVLSPYGDKYGPRKMITIALLGCAAACSVMACASGYTQIFFAWTVAGVFQAVAFPLMMKALSPWFSVAKRGQVLGFWTTCQQIGGVAAVSCAGYLADSPTTTWRDSFSIPAIMNVAAAIVVFTFMVESPSDAICSSSTSSLAGKKKGTPGPESHNVSFVDVLRLPYLVNLGAGYFCIKLARYTMLGWLPMYLVQARGYTIASAAYMSTLFDVGGAVGSVVCGYLAKNAGQRMRITFIMCLLTGVCIVTYGFVAGWGFAVNAFSMTLAGFMVAGPDSIMGGAACTDICDKSKYGSSVLTTASGIVNGMGSIGAILSGIVPVFIFEAFGWRVLFAVVGALAILGGFAIFPVVQMSKR